MEKAEDSSEMPQLSSTQEGKHTKNNISQGEIKKLVPSSKF